MLRRSLPTALMILAACLPLAAEPREADYGNLKDGSTGYAFTCLSLPSTPVSVLGVSQRSAEKSYLVALDNLLKKEKAANPAWCGYQDNASGRNALTRILGLIPGLTLNTRLTYTLSSRLTAYAVANKVRTCRVETWVGTTDYPDASRIPVDRMLVKVRDFEMAASGTAVTVTQTAAGEAAEFPNPGDLTWTVDMKTHRMFVTSSTYGEIRRYNGVCFGKEESGTRTPTGLNLRTWSPKWLEKDSQYVGSRDSASRARAYDYYHVAETPSADFRRFNRNVHAGLTRIENHDYTTPEGLRTGFIYGGLPRIRYNYKSPGNDYYGFAFHGREDADHVYGQNHSHGCCHLPPEVIKEAFFLACQWYRWNPAKSIAVKIYWDKEAGIVHRPGREATYGRIDRVTGY